MPMQKLTIELPSDLKHALSAIAVERGVSLSSVIREALAEYIERERQAAWQQVSITVSDGS